MRRELQVDKDFCDVILACEDKQIKTHKVVISSCSPIFQNILKLNHILQPFIYLRRVRYKDLLNLVTFMHQGEVNVTEDDLSIFLEAAEDLQIRGLSEVNTKQDEKDSFSKLHKQSISPPKRTMIFENESEKY